MSVVVTVVDDRADPGPWYRLSRFTGPMAAATRIGEVYMTSAQTMVDNVLGAVGTEKIRWLNILDHGNPRGLQLGSDWVSMATVGIYEPTLRRLAGHFTPNATVHLQHCEIGNNDALMRTLARFWGCKVRAGRGLHNPVYRVNLSLSPYRICNATRCWNEEPPKHEKMCCFPAGTPIWSPQGMRPIESFAPGEPLFARDTGGATKVAAVTKLEQHRGRFPLKNLRTAEGGKLSVTDGHRFMDPALGWTATEDLSAGGSLNAIERPRVLTSATPEAPVSEVFNLRVEGLANYYVGREGLLARDH